MSWHTRAATLAISSLLAIFAMAATSPDDGALPGAPAIPPDVRARIERMRKTRGPGYRPHTRHLRPDGTAKYTNRLFLETSPYLLQHAHNPVNWYPWGDEAFETARARGVPVFLSIGYSTCHWCHVMEEESFEDEEIAGVMNESYVAIKVDREERPDLDAVYMTAVQALTGGGGWPMSVWLTPDRKPFFGGTYFPARDGDRGGVGFLTLLGKLKQIYATQPDRVAQASQEMAAVLARGSVAARGAAPDATVLAKAFALYKSRFDAIHGGLEEAPKFPSNLPIRFLLREYRRTGDASAIQMAKVTLQKMAAGGIHDQVGGGFHRYSTDAQWLVPHFEKMLYDNALLAMAYIEAYQATHEDDFRVVAEEILRYVARDMMSPDGAFYSATDADSLGPTGERQEGRFFTWTPDEIEQVLGKEKARPAIAYFGVTPDGDLDGRSVLSVPKARLDVARELGVAPEKLDAAIGEAREALDASRRRRPPPLRDEKVLTSWNGLAISAFARAALALGNDEDARIAARAARFVLAHLRQDGRLLRSYTDGRASHAAYVDDYAFLIAGLLDLYEATGDPSWLREAIDLDRVLDEHYEDAKGGGFYRTADDAEQLLTREKPAYDGAEPCGNSVEALNLLRLSELTTDDRYRKRASRTLEAFGSTLAASPAALSEMLSAVDFQLETPREIVIVRPGGKRLAEPMLAELRSAFVPNRVLVVVSEGKEVEGLAKLVPLVEGKKALQHKTTAYVCEHGRCKLPTTDPAVFAKQIAERPTAP